MADTPSIRNWPTHAALEGGDDFPLAVLQQERALDPLLHLFLPAGEDGGIHGDQSHIQRVGSCHTLSESSQSVQARVTSEESLACQENSDCLAKKI